ncbi:MAG: TolC family protein [Nitrospirae bacterium]|nr:TolC family protein [Nitrospirota bacterium]
MKRLFLRVLVLALIGVLAVPLISRAAAEADVRSDRTLSFFIEEALRNNPELMAMKENVKAIHESIPQTTALEDPEFRVQQTTDSGLSAMATRYEIGQEIPFPGKRALRGGVAAREADAAEQAYQAKVREVVADVKRSYYKLILAYKTIDLHVEHQRLLEEFIRIAETKYAVGQVAQQDVLKAQVELSRLHTSLLVLEQEKVLTQAGINTLINRPPDTPVDQPMEPVFRSFSPSLEDLKGKALQERPELREADFQIEKSRQTKILSEKNRLPDFTAEVMYEDVHTGPDQWMLAGKINFPWIFREKYDARIRQAAAEEGRARARYNVVRNETWLQLQDLFTKVKTTEELIQVYQQGVLPQAEQSLEAARIGYQAGKVDFLDLIDSDRTLRDFQLEFFTALSQFWQYTAELERVAGVSLDF